MKTFEELDLIVPVRRALADEKYEIPTPIQAQTVPAALLGRDILGCAQTGTGKTAAFALPILNRLGQQNRRATPKRPLVLILAPTRELAIQIGQSCATYGRHLHLRQALVYGGVSQGSQVRAMTRGVHILVATPGRLLDLMNQGYIELDRLEILVLDEADRMLDMGFLPDLRRIISKLPAERQSLFFSATMPPKIIELSQTLLRDPVNVNVTPKSTSVEKIEQRVMFVEKSGKLALLKQILRAPETERALVFTKTKRAANMLAEKLVHNGFKATAIHGNKSQGARQRALEAFRNKQVQVLVATDVAARGIDIDSITHVVNYDLPIEPESYVHRIGRTGRAGAEGIALSFCCANEGSELRAIEELIGQELATIGDQPRPRSREYKPRPLSRAPRSGGSQRSGSQRSTSQKSGYRGSRAKSTGSKSTGAKSSGTKSFGSRRTAEASGQAGRPKQKRR